jgi:hypothetical protein
MWVGGWVVGVCLGLLPVGEGAGRRRAQVSEHPREAVGATPPLPAWRALTAAVRDPAPLGGRAARPGETWLPAPPARLQAGRGRTALELHEEMLEAGLQSNVAVVTSLVRALGAQGMVDEVLSTFRRIIRGPARQVERFARRLHSGRGRRRRRDHAWRRAVAAPVAGRRQGPGAAVHSCHSESQHHPAPSRAPAGCGLTAPRMRR